MERAKLIHIFFCARFLGLHRDDLIPEYRDGLKDVSVDELVRDSAVRPPKEFSFWRVFDPRFSNSAVFIMRMHIAIMLFAVLYVVGRLTLEG